MIHLKVNKNDYTNSEEKSIILIVEKKIITNKTFTIKSINDI